MANAEKLVSASIMEQNVNITRQHLAQKADIFQVAVLPTASADNADKVYQYIGATNGNLIKGRFYQNVNNEWVSIAFAADTDSAITQNSTNPVESQAIYAALADKVDVDGDKVLSDNNYSNADKAIVDGVSDALDGKVDKNGTDRLMTAAEGTKLAELENYDDTALAGRVTANENAITLLNKTDGTSGSVKKTVDDAIAAVVANAPSDLDTLKEISDWISGHEDDAAGMNTAIQANTTAITNIKNGTDVDSFGDVEDALDDKQDATLATPIEGQSTVEGALQALSEKSVEVDNATIVKDASTGELSAVTATNSSLGVVTDGDGTSIGANGEINVVDRLEETATLPTATVDNLNKCYLLTGTQSGYQKGGTYQCQETSTGVYGWVLISSAEVPVATSSINGISHPDDETIHVDGSGELSVDEGYKTAFVGTESAWNNLSTDTKKTFDTALITDDSDTADIVDAVTAGDMRAVTSNATYLAIRNRSRQTYVSGAVDIDDYTTPGVYVFDNAVTSTAHAMPTSVTHGGTLFVFGTGNGRHQIFITNLTLSIGSHYIYYRASTSWYGSGTWEAWQRIALSTV